MITRLYVSGYKCLVNFDWLPARMNLLLGYNGSGKSAVMEVLQHIKVLGTRAGTLVSDVFKPGDLPAWLKLTEQRFELEVLLEGQRFHYILQIEYNQHESGKNRIKEEILRCDGQLVFEFILGEVNLYKHDYSPGPQYTFDWNQSILANIPERNDKRDNPFLIRFRQFLASMLLLQINPLEMSESLDSQTTVLNPLTDGSNLAAWYKYLSENQHFSLEVTEILQQVLPGFHYFQFEKIGTHSSRLKTWFQEPNKYCVGFQNLSSGQKMLITLYICLKYLELYTDESQGEEVPFRMVFLDEPDSFLALPEIQPIIVQLDELVQKGMCQAFVISHHPEIINYQFPDASPQRPSWLFSRPNAGFVQVRKFDHDSGLAPADLLAKNWLPGK